MTDLPIVDVLEDIRTTLRQGDELVLEAPPGAGKTTQVPLALLAEPWLQGQRILLLEPRRIAARAAAERMAELLGEKPGETVGYRMRMDSCISQKTRIEVITEGVLIRLLQDDPSLCGIGLVIFDEFHERSLDADLGLALCLEGRKLFSDLRQQPLKILLMSATLDGSRIAELVNKAPIISSAGRQYPVTLRYGDSFRFDQDIVERVSQTVCDALAQETGSILVFLPGQAEIRRCATQLHRLVDKRVVLAPLYGDLSLADQRLAIAPMADGRRKVVLATSIAESSLTIEGIRVVVDSGLARQSAFDPRTAMSRLQTRRLSRSSATQRAGRAGRLGEGVCYRLWSESQQAELAAHSEAEINQAELSSLMLQLYCWGVDDPADLSWLDIPPRAACKQAVDLLLLLGALHQEGERRMVTAHGKAMAALPLHPRLAHMLLKGRALGWSELACDIAALLADRDIGPRGSADIVLRLALLNGQRAADRQQQGLLMRLKKQRQQFSRLLAASAAVAGKVQITADPAVLLAFAYPDRIARQRRQHGRDYVLSNGRAASLFEGDGMSANLYLVIAEMGGKVGERSDTIYLAAALNPEHFNQLLSSLVVEQNSAEWDDGKGRFIAERRRSVGTLVVERQPIHKPPQDLKNSAIVALIRRRGLLLLNCSEALQQWRARVELLRQLDCAPGAWPDLSDEALLATLDAWLSPYLNSTNSLSGLKSLDLQDILSAGLDWSQRQTLDSLAPSHFKVPSGSTIKIDYCQPVPVLAVKLQEMFGCATNPMIAGGRQPLLLHLLSPARRPLQVTQDLAGFWQGSYHDVKKEMKGRYPKHPWPEDPTTAQATARLKPRGT
jgi:ATP-dependent helicase HrpB